MGYKDLPWYTRNGERRKERQIGGDPLSAQRLEACVSGLGLFGFRGFGSGRGV